MKELRLPKIFSFPSTFTSNSSFPIKSWIMKGYKLTWKNLAWLQFQAANEHTFLHKFGFSRECSFRLVRAWKTVLHSFEACKSDFFLRFSTNSRFRPWFTVFERKLLSYYNFHSSSRVKVESFAKAVPHSFAIMLRTQPFPLDLTFGDDISGLYASLRHTQEYQNSRFPKVSRSLVYLKSTLLQNNGGNVPGQEEFHHDPLHIGNISFHSLNFSKMLNVAVFYISTSFFPIMLAMKVWMLMRLTCHYQWEY